MRRVPIRVSAKPCPRLMGHQSIAEARPIAYEQAMERQLTHCLRLRPCLVFFAWLSFGLLSACVNGRDLGPPEPALGSFLLGHVVVVEDNAVRGPLSREATPGAWKEALEAEFKRRFGRYDGERYYHFAIHVDGYVLALPGVPVVASPRSVLIASVTVWDDALGRPLHDAPRMFTVFESVSPETIVGSGLTQSADEQIAALARNLAGAIERWLTENPEWFDHSPRREAQNASAQADPA